MLGAIFTIILTIIIGIVQVSLVPQLAFWGIFPDLALIILLSLILNERWETSFWMALGIGIIIDLSSANTFGVYIVSTIVVLFTILALRKIIGTRYNNILQWIILGVVGALLQVVLINSLGALFALIGVSAVALPTLASILRIALPSAGLTVVFFVLLMPLITRILDNWKNFRTNRSLIQNTK